MLELDPNFRKIAASALAAAIVQVRGETHPAALVRAVQEAEWALFPEMYIDSVEYREWWKNSAK